MADAREIEFEVYGDIPTSIWERESDTGGSRPSMVWNTAYVAVPKSHPWYRQEYNDIELPDYVHGGLTFSGFLVGGGFPCGPEIQFLHEQEAWFVGIDFNHAGDLAFDSYERRYDLDEVRKNAQKLASMALEAMRTNLIEQEAIA